MLNVLGRKFPRLYERLFTGNNFFLILANVCFICPMKRIIDQYFDKLPTNLGSLHFKKKKSSGNNKFTSVVFLVM